MQVLKVDSEITVLYKIIITVFFIIIIKIHLLSQHLFILCVFERAPLQSYSYSTWRIQRGGLCPPGHPVLVTTYSPSTATCVRCPSPSSHNVVKSCGLSPMRATDSFLGYMFATPSFIQNLHVAQKRVGARYGVGWHPKCLNWTFFADPIKSFFFFFLIFIYPRKQTGPTSNPNFWLGSPKSVTITSMIGT